jgi:hypothetical protein
MIYSVWNPGTRKYAYYTTAEGHKDDVPEPAVRCKTKLGCSPNDIAWTLPANARKLGVGEDARGIVVHPSGGSSGLVGGLGAVETFESKVNAITYGVLALFGAWQLWQWTERRDKRR